MVDFDIHLNWKWQRHVHMHSLASDKIILLIKNPERDLLKYPNICILRNPSSVYMCQIWNNKASTIYLVVKIYVALLSKRWLNKIWECT